MSVSAVFILGFLPAIVLFAFIYFKDRSQPEPAGKLLKAFFFGVLSILLSLTISHVISLVFPCEANYDTMAGAAYNAFGMAAIPEEAAKLIMLLLVLRNNRYFDEKFDGIVYSVCVTLGFAAVENVMYLWGSGSDFMSTAITRALLSVPTHFLCGVIMGYFVSLAKFYPVFRTRNMILAFVVPMLAHGLYDWLLMYCSGGGASISGVLLMSVLALCYFMWKVSLRFIREHLTRDVADMSAIQEPCSLDKE